MVLDACHLSILWLCSNDALLVFKKSQFSNSTQPDGTESAGSWVTDAPKPRY